MARSPSKILSAAELKIEQKLVQTEIAAHASQAKAAEKIVKDAKRKLDADLKQLDGNLKSAERAHLMGCKIAQKAFDAVVKEQGKVSGAAEKATKKAEARAAALAPQAAKASANDAPEAAAAPIGHIKLRQVGPVNGAAHPAG